MPHSDAASRIRREQKKSLLLRELSGQIANLSLDEPILKNVAVTRVELSQGEGTCTIYFASHSGEEGYREALQILLLYKGSLRTAIAKAMQGRHTPHIIFAYDTTVEKERQMQELLDKVKKDDAES